LLTPGADRHGVGGFAKYKATGEIAARRRRHHGTAPQSEDKPIVRKYFAGTESQRTLCEIDAGGDRVQPHRHVLLLVPVRRHEMEPRHGSAAIDQSADCHTVVEKLTFFCDDVDLTRRRQSTNLVDGRHPGCAVAYDDDFRDPGIETEIEFRLL